MADALVGATVAAADIVTETPTKVCDGANGDRDADARADPAVSLAKMGGSSDTSSANSASVSPVPAADTAASSSPSSIPTTKSLSPKTQLIKSCQNTSAKA